MSPAPQFRRSARLKLIPCALLALVCAAGAPAAEPPAAPSATPIKHSLKTCNKQADAKKLTGAARATYVKYCQGPQKTS